MGRWARSRAAFYGYRGLAACLRTLPEPLALAGAELVSLGLAERRGASAQMRLSHLDRVLRATGQKLDPSALRRMTRSAFRAYARYWVDGARLPKTSAQEVSSRMQAEGLEHLENALAAGCGVVLALPHVGSWEWGGSWLSAIGFPMTSVAEVLEPPELFRWFIDQRRAIGLTVVPLDKEAGLTLLRTLRQGKLVGLLCDRDLVGNGVEVEFFGERTTLPGGPATLALRAGAVLLTTAVYSGSNGQHYASVSAPIDTSRSGPIGEDVSRITQEIARHFEEYICRAPEQWHMFQPNWPSDRAALR